MSIVGRGLGRPAAGALVAFGLGLVVTVEPPIVVIDEVADDRWAEPPVTFGGELERISGEESGIAWWSEPTLSTSAADLLMTVWSEPGPDRWTEPVLPGDNDAPTDEWSEPT